jgi:antitoxin (DNA-binding transcriptional repressor) of toxin-antitoxin stability system
MTRRGAALQLRKVRGAGVELVRPGHPPVVAKRGTPVAKLIGEPGEIVLFLNGRRGVAEIERSGDPSAIAILEAADLGI